MNTRPVIPCLLIPRGKKPERKTPHATGYDAYVRAIVSTDTHQAEPWRRQEIFDFKEKSPSLNGHARFTTIERVPQWVYVLKPEETVCVGLGFVLGMESGFTAWTVPRSSSALSAIELQEVEVRDCFVGIPIDSDFRGEPIAVIRNCGTSDYLITYGKRITQIVFQREKRGLVFPTLQEVRDYTGLSKTVRGARAHASTGVGVS